MRLVCAEIPVQHTDTPEPRRTGLFIRVCSQQGSKESWRKEISQVLQEVEYGRDQS